MPTFWFLRTSRKTAAMICRVALVISSLPYLNHEKLPSVINRDHHYFPLLNGNRPFETRSEKAAGALLTRCTRDDGQGSCPTTFKAVMVPAKITDKPTDSETVGHSPSSGT